MRDHTVRPSFDDYFMGVALAVRERANCLGRRVGAIVVLDQRIIATGYNGTAERTPNCLDGGCYPCDNRDSKYARGTNYDLCICVHAEQNAMLAAARLGISIKGSTVYTTIQPCLGCSKEMLQAGVDGVCYIEEWTPPPGLEGEYTKLQAAFRKKVSKIDIDDPDREWALHLTASSITSTPVQKMPPFSHN